MKKRRQIKVKVKRRSAPKVARSRHSSVAGKDKKIALLTRERDEALEQQTATADVLKAISQSAFNLQPVLESIVETAARLCDAEFGIIFKLQDKRYHVAASNNADEAFVRYASAHPILPGRGSLVGRVALEGTTVHLPDCLADPEYTLVDYQSTGKFRSDLGVPLLRGGVVIGVIALMRTVIKPFTDKQIDLVTNFAAQAVIAIENTRLLNELRQRTDDLSESLEQQTATSEVLQVISASRGELQAVFETMLRNAVNICDAKFGNIYRWNDEALTLVGAHNTPAALVEARNRQAIRPAPSTGLGRVITGKTVVHIPDLTLEQAYIDRQPITVEAVELAHIRTFLGVPMLKDRELIGAITIFRQEVRPFTQKQIELVQNFAAQAVIAIENARLLNDLRESLQQQTATADVLKVISSSPGELEPVFASMLESATRICGAKFGTMYRYDGTMLHPVADHNTPSALLEYQIKRGSFVPEPGRFFDRMVRAKKVMHIADVAAEESPPPPARYGGAHSLVLVPMLRDDELVGIIVIYRQEVRPFTEKQIELVQNFAAQAVIAIENTRLLNELRESLQQQTATSEVLKVISSSPGELEPVFQSMLANAMRICEAKFGGLFLYKDDGVVHNAALLGLPPRLADFLEKAGPRRPKPGSPLNIVWQTKQVLHVLDEMAEPVQSLAATLGGSRSTVAVPMLKEGELIGAIIIFRQEVRPFTDKQIELVQNFAAQAVIAIENTRLLNELRDSLQRQTATSEVLKVVSSSPGDLQPVFQAMLENATRICDAKLGMLYRREGELYRIVAMHGAPPDYVEERTREPTFKAPLGGALASLVETKQAMQIPDITAEPTYARSVIARSAGARTLLSVPMLKDNEVIGAISIYRQEVRPFSDKQVELLSDFAAQAVIAIENTRLLNELRESLQQQTAAAKVLSVISSSPGELRPVFEAMLENATRICDAGFGTLWQFDGQLFQRVASVGTPTAFIQFQDKRGPFVPPTGTSFNRMMITKEVVYTADEAAEPTPGMAAKLGGARSAMYVPMLKENDLVGAIVIYRKEVRPFTEKQVALVQNFAAQAVIAIENTRLLNELRESLQQQTATADVLKVISRSTFNLKSVLETLVQSAALLCDADGGIIRRQQAENYPVAATFGLTDRQREHFEQYSAKPDRQSIFGRAVLEGRTIHVPDVLADPEHNRPGQQQFAKRRALLGVPLTREGAVVGVFTLHREEPRPFTDKQIELVSTFADQAVIAIENVRLFDEIQDKSRQLAEASQHKSQFLANMSHELRTPLNAILGYTELILDGIYGETPEKAQAVLKRVESNGRHLLGLINDVLDLSKIEAGQLKLTLADYSIKDIVHGVYSALEPLAAKKNLNLKVAVPDNVPGAHGDERKLTQVLLNLVGNAIKFTDQGEVAINVAAENGSLSIAVRDTGPGIAPADQAKLFEEFQQADNSITKTKGGTGLGLAISKRFIELHGGQIALESRVGHGSTFKVALPIKVERQVDLP